MTRGITALVVLFAVSSVWAQAPDPGRDDWARPESRQERRERVREERRERIEEARDARRERMERFRERFDDDGVHLRILRSYSLAEGETAKEPIVVIGGSVRIDGHAEEDVVVIGGSLHLGPKAVVDGNAVSVLGSVMREPGATVNGSIDESAIPWPNVTFDPDWDSSGWWSGLAFWGSLLRLSFVMALAVILTLLAPGWIATISDRTAGVSILTGLAVEVLFVPAVVILMVALTVSIVGIPLLLGIPFLLAAFAFVWVAGFTGVAVRLGRALRRKDPMLQPSVLDFLLGYAVIIGVTVIAQMTAFSFGWLSPSAWSMRSAGLLVEYVAWTIGLGAAVISLFGARRIVPPPVPV